MTKTKNFVDLEGNSLKGKVTLNLSLNDLELIQGGTFAKLNKEEAQENNDHRLTLRIPRWLLDKIDIKRKERVGTISRNLWILETLEKNTKEI